jgi:Skp family chaperone for outer membrane proteins
LKVVAEKASADEPEDSAKRRTWTDSTGKHTIEAEFKGVAAGKVKLLKADGETITIALDKLSDEDQAWIKDRPRAEESRRSAAAIERKRVAEERQREARLQAAAEERRREAASKNLGITKAAYDRIQTGMTYRQVVEIIGQQGEELSRNSIGGEETVMCQWTTRTGPNMNAIFQGGRLVQKAQFGLE